MQRVHTLTVRQHTHNKHHGIPTSRGGSDHRMNLTTVQIARHNRFHEWAENNVPTHLAKLIAIHSIGFHERTMSPRSIETILQITTLSNWSRLYFPEAIAGVSDRKSIDRAEVSFQCTITRMYEEISLIRRTIEALENGGHFPGMHSRIMLQGLPFFHAKSPGETIEKLLTEKGSNGLAWAKPIINRTRLDILNASKSAKLISIKRETRSSLLNILNNHEHVLKNHLSLWESRTSNNAENSKAL